MIDPIRPRGWQRRLQFFASSRVGVALLAHVMHHLDGPLLGLSNGRLSLGGPLVGLPIIMLTTTGARSGEWRSLPLIAIPDGDTLVLIASSYGRARHPGWYHNLRAHPEALVLFDGCTATYVAREAEGEERERYWRRAVELFPGYAVYAQRTGGRRVPVMVLEPKDRR